MQLDRQLSDQLEQEAALQKNRIRLGFGMGRSSQMIEEIIPAFLAKYPEVQIISRSQTGRKQMMELQNGYKNEKKSPNFGLFFSSIIGKVCI